MPDSLSQYEGTVAPSFLATKDHGKFRDFLSKLPLRMGRITKAHAPYDPSNRSKGLFWEYDVVVEEGSENAPSTRTTLPHCWVMSEFGGAADFSRSTFRAMEGSKKVQSREDFGLGSRVLVLCINASSFAGVIVGGIQHGQGEKDDVSKGHHSIWQFNGVRREVDKDGQYHVTMKGATDAAGNLVLGADPLASGSGYHLLKDGTVQWDAKKEWQQTSFGASNIVSQTSNIAMDTPLGFVQTSGLGVRLGLATNSMLLGTAYRAAETSLHATEIASWSGVAAAHAASAAAWAAFAPFSVILEPTGTLAATALTAAAAEGVAAAAAGAAAAALGTFEAATPTFLSIKNMLD